MEGLKKVRGERKVLQEVLVSIRRELKLMKASIKPEEAEVVEDAVQAVPKMIYASTKSDIQVTKGQKRKGRNNERGKSRLKNNTHYYKRVQL